MPTGVPEVPDFIKGVLDFCAETVPFRCWCWQLAADDMQPVPHFRLTGAGQGPVVVVPTPTIRLALLIAFAFEPSGAFARYTVVVGDDFDDFVRSVERVSGSLPDDVGIVMDWWYDPREQAVSDEGAGDDPGNYEPSKVNLHLVVDNDGDLIDRTTGEVVGKAALQVVPDVG